jgi:hypothetical protein
VLDLFVRWRKAGLLLVLLVSACGGGGDSNKGSDSGQSTTVSPSSLTFKADSPTAGTPAGQVVTVTFGTNIAHLALTHQGLAIGDVTATFSGRTAQVTITPGGPVSTGAGLFDGKVAVTGYLCADATCSAFAAGETQTIDVHYQVSPGIAYVAPYVAISQVEQNVILRGFGFSRFNITDVHFGTAAAAAFLVGDDSQLIAQVPALPAGVYPVTIDASNHDGPIPSQATLTVVDAIAYPAQTLSYPAPATLVNSLVYDAERRSILVGTDAAGSQITRYTYDAGTWTPQSSSAISPVRDLTLSTNGAQIYAISDTQLTIVNPTTLAVGASFSAPDLGSDTVLRSIAMSNTNVAYVTSAGQTADEQTPVYAFSELIGALNEVSLLNYGTVESNASGTTTVAVQGDPITTASAPVYVHRGADSGTTFSPISLNLHQTAAETAMDRSGSRVVLAGSIVYDNSFTTSASIPVADYVTVSPDGNRLYAYYAASNALQTYDISTFTDGATLTSIGTTTLSANPGASVKMTITPDGQTLIIAGANQIVIQPTPSF